MQRRIDPTSDRPVYRQLADILRAKITSREWEPGRQLPSEARLGDEYEVSQATIRRALALLRAEGRIVRQRGKVAAVSEREQIIIRFNHGDNGYVQFRQPTPGEQQAEGVEDAAWVAVVTMGGQTRVMAVSPHLEIYIGDGAPED